MSAKALKSRLYIQYTGIEVDTSFMIRHSICMVIGVLSKRLSTGSLAASMIMLFSLMLTDIFNNKGALRFPTRLLCA